MKKRLIIHFTLLCLFFTSLQAQSDHFIEDLLKKHPDKFANILQNAADKRVQILYTQIDRDKNNQPTFRSYRFRVQTNEYFYPASTVKFPACLLALEKLNGLNLKDVHKNTWMLTDSCEGIPNYPPQYNDSTALDFRPSIAQYIKKILLVSDNDANNRLYEFIGQELFNKNLYLKGYKDLRIVHRLDIAMSRLENRRSNPIRFVSDKEVEIDTITQIDPDTYETKTIVKYRPKNIYSQSQQLSATTFEPENPIKIGKGYVKNGKIVEEPFDFTYKNCFPIDNQQAILRAVLFPESVAKEQRFNLTNDDYNLILKYMSMSPLESSYPHYPDKDSSGAWDSYCKFLMFGDSKKPMPKHIRIFNKVGDAYGFLTDNAYVVDFEKGVEFMLTATIYCNSDGIFNDDTYDYETVGMPFMAHLGQTIYDYEVKRKRPNKPDLAKFKLKY